MTTLARKVPQGVVGSITQSAVGRTVSRDASNDMEALVSELGRRVNAPAGVDPLLKFEGPMSMEQIRAQLKELQLKARAGQIK